MCKKIRVENVSSLVGYTYPKLHKGKNWYVDFYALDPITQIMKRKKYCIGADLRIAEKNRRATEIINVVTKKLMTGWNPWINVNESRGFVPFEDCINRYLFHVEKMDRKKTKQSYNSKINIMKEFIAKCNPNIKYVFQFDSSFCNDFIDWIYLDRQSSPRTRNNYRGWLYSFAEFLLARKFIEKNPVENIKNLPLHDKKRKDLSPDMLKTMSVHLSEVDKPFLLACLMQYYTLIRPGELSNLKIENISIKKQTIFVSKQFSKNHKDAEVGLNNTIIKLMLDLEIFKYPNHYYIFGSNFLPSKNKIGADHFNKRWKVMRKKLHWGDCYQFYSLKDSGIRDLANAQGVVVARDQARHSDIATTNKYIQKHSVQPVTLSFQGNLTYDNDIS